MSSASVSPPEPFASGLLAGRYRFQAELGQGGMGMLYRAVDTQTGAIVAVKALKPEIVSGNPELLARFVREGEALRQLNHPNIVKMLADVSADGRHYLIMEYVSGGDLRRLLDREAPLPVVQVLEMGLDLADALTRAHRLEIIHRDLKPGNILIAADGTPRLADFGVAHVVASERLTGTHAVIGTLEYLSPELLKAEALDARTDIWSFGVLLYEMLVGNPPFAGANIAEVLTAILNEPTPDLEQVRQDIPVALVDLIYRMLEKERQARIGSIRHVGAALEDILQDRAEKMAPKRFETPAPDTATIARLRHNLPAQTTPFVGRERELAALATLVDDPHVRLITILAPGGMGKSRLALELAERVVKDGAESTPVLSRPLFADGVYFVNLASISAVTEIVPAIAAAVDFDFQGAGEQKQQIFDFLREKEMLLLMDNYEHLLVGAELLSTILATAPGVQVLVTSRERLRRQEETLFRIEGLALPARPAPEETLGSDAMRLFLQSARRVQPGFQFQAEDRRHVAAICRHVQGMPLALVLAAAWVEALSPAEIAAEIARCLDFLEADVHNIPDRHRSIRAVFNSTWNRLDESEQLAFQKLSVFRGGFTREAAQVIAGANLRQLTALLGKSLLRRDPISGRFIIHELLRQYAAERLRAAADLEAAVRERHSDYYTEFMNRPIGEFLNANNKATLKTIDPEINNFRAAWQWAIVHRRFRYLDQAITGLYWYSWVRSWHEEGESAIREAVKVMRAAEPNDENQIILARALTLQAAMDIWLGRAAQAEERAREGETILRPLNSQPDLAGALAIQGWAALEQQKWTTAKTLLEEAVALYDDASQSEVKAFSLGQLGHIARFEGDYVAGEHWYQAALNLGRKIGDQRTIAESLVHLGNLAQWRGHYFQARRLYQEGLEVARVADFATIIIGALHNLGAVAVVLGELDVARDHFEESLSVATEDGKGPGIAWSHIHLAGVAITQGDHAVAEEHFQAALKISPGMADRGRYAVVQAGRGRIALQTKDTGAARRHFETSMALNREMGYRADTIDNLLSLARIALVEGDFGEAAGNLEAALQLAIAEGAPLHHLLVFAGFSELFMKQGALGDAVRLAALVAQHPAGSAESRSWAETLLNSPPASTVVTKRDTVSGREKPGDLTKLSKQLLERLLLPPAQPFVEGLTERELEVLHLVAAGKSNREIAQELFLAVGTVKTHLHNIMQKLDAANRTQAVARARELQLL